VDTSRERRSLQIAIGLAFALLVGLAAVMQAALEEAHATLDERQANVLAVRTLQKTCADGDLPNEADLVAVARLFPDARLTCLRIEDVVYLTFDDESVPVGSGLAVLQER